MKITNFLYAYVFLNHCQFVDIEEVKAKKVLQIQFVLIYPGGQVLEIFEEIY